MTENIPTAEKAFSLGQAWVYLDGQFSRYADAKVGLLTHGLNYGTGCFEGIRAYWNADQGQLFGLLLEEHYKRLQRSARALTMNLPYSVEELCEITLEVLRRNQFRENVLIKALLFKSGEEVWVRMHDIAESFAVLAIPMGDYVPTGGMRCMVSSWRRIDDNVAPPRTKCTGIYINSALAKSEAVAAGFDEAVMLTGAGNICEGSGENIFLVRDGVVFTPPPSDNILEGITRQSLMQLFREELGVTVVERSLGRSELYVADEVFMCGTAAQVAPVTEIDRRVIGDGQPGPLTVQVQKLYRAASSGENPKYAKWLRPTW